MIEKPSRRTNLLQDACYKQIGMSGEECGETTGANWIRIGGGKKLCLDCYKSYDRFNV